VLPTGSIFVIVTIITDMKRLLSDAKSKVLAKKACRRSTTMNDLPAEVLSGVLLSAAWLALPDFESACWLNECDARKRKRWADGYTNGAGNLRFVCAKWRILVDHLPEWKYGIARHHRRDERIESEYRMASSCLRNESPFWIWWMRALIVPSHRTSVTSTPVNDEPNAIRTRIFFKPSGPTGAVGAHIVTAHGLKPSQHIQVTTTDDVDRYLGWRRDEETIGKCQVMGLVSRKSRDLVSLKQANYHDHINAVSFRPVLDCQKWSAFTGEQEPVVSLVSTSDFANIGTVRITESLSSDASDEFDGDDIGAVIPPNYTPNQIHRWTHNDTLSFLPSSEDTVFLRKPSFCWVQRVPRDCDRDMLIAAFPAAFSHMIERGDFMDREEIAHADGNPRSSDLYTVIMDNAGKNIVGVFQFHVRAVKCTDGETRRVSIREFGTHRRALFGEQLGSTDSTTSSIMESEGEEEEATYKRVVKSWNAVSCDSLRVGSAIDVARPYHDTRNHFFVPQLEALERNIWQCMRMISDIMEERERLMMITHGEKDKTMDAAMKCVEDKLAKSKQQVRTAMKVMNKRHQT
jgi:hypothetical protein